MWFDIYEDKIQDAVQEFNKNAKFGEYYMMSNSGIFQAFSSDLAGDLVFVLFSFALIFVYSVSFLGSCSPVHCRLTLALWGIFCIIMSYLTGFGICFMYEYEVTNIHNFIPFLLLGVGVDDMFVLCNAVDQTSYDLPY